VDVRSIGAGGGSIAWIDSGGLLRVGPHSAGADPGPACYGKGGDRPTVTDAALVLGYLDPERFLGGRMALDLEAASAVLAPLAAELGMDEREAALAIMTLANEHMVAAIKEITINQGIDPRESAVIAGGGAAGLGIAAIAHELGCRQVLMPRTAGALSAFGAQQADIVAEAGSSLLTDTERFDFERVEQTLGELDSAFTAVGEEFGRHGLQGTSVDYLVEARYAHQVWEIEIPLRSRLASEQDVREFEQDFHAAHERVFAVTDPDQRIETIYWKGRLTARPPKPPLRAGDEAGAATSRTRSAYFPGVGAVDVSSYEGGSLEPGTRLEGPLLVTEPTTTIVVPPGTTITVTELGNYLLEVA
jgi:N-methylhydantoinase A